MAILGDRKMGLVIFYVFLKSPHRGRGAKAWPVLIQDITFCTKVPIRINYRLFLTITAPRPSSKSVIDFVQPKAQSTTGI